MSKGVINATVLGLLLCGGAGLAQDSAPPSGFQWQGGEQVYTKVCSHCHENEVGPALRGRDLPAVYFSTIARSGLRAMPAFREAEIDDLSLQALAEFLANSAVEEE